LTVEMGAMFAIGLMEQAQFHFANPEALTLGQWRV